MLCKSCSSEIRAEANYCGACGCKIDNSKLLDYNIHIKKIAVFFFILLAYIATLYFINAEKSYLKVIIFDTLFSFIVLGFIFFDPNKISSLLKFKRLNFKLIILIIVTSFILAYLVTLLTGFINQTILDTEKLVYYELFEDSPAPFFLSILSIALFPAIFEELAFRGIILIELLNITGIKSSIIISSILFTLLHISIISSLWIFPLGIVFGYLTVKHKTLWYSIIGHFFYNSSIVIIEVLSK